MHCEMQYGDKNKAPIAAFQELKMAYGSMCKIHKLPLIPGFQNANMVTIKAKYGRHKIKFMLSLSSRLVQLQEEVAKRLPLEAGTYHVLYKDEEDYLILIACDEDLQLCMHTFRSLGKTSIEVLLEDLILQYFDPYKHNEKQVANYTMLCQSLGAI